MNYPLLPYQYLVDRLLRDTRLSDSSLKLDDLREWIAEAARGLMAPRAYSTRTVNIAYENYRCELPSDWAGIQASSVPVKRHYDQLLLRWPIGVVTVTYYVLPCDEEGMPMLIDHPHALDYYFWYVAEKLAMLGELPPAFNPQLCSVRKFDYLQAAKNVLRMPTSPYATRFTPPAFRD